MQLYHAGVQLAEAKSIKYRKRDYSTRIITLDTETTSYKNKAGDYRATLYEWQACNGAVELTCYGRDYKSLRAYLEEVSKANAGVWQIIYIHNLGFDFEFLRNLAYEWDVFARTAHKPIFARNTALKIELRDSLTYFHKPLAVLAKDMGLEVQKQEGYDYGKIRHSLTPLTEDELSYGEKDVQALFLALNKELETYKHICKLPYTQTGKVRRVVMKKVLRQKKYDTSELVPNVHMFLRLQKAFIGGYTHANFRYAGDILNDVDSDDFASSYPYVMCAEKYPIGKWIKVTKLRRGMRHLIHVKFYRLESALDFPYLPTYSAIKTKGMEADNGKLWQADFAEYLLTDVDFSVVLQAYSIESYELVDIWASYADYLPKPFVEFILDQYGKKTQLKGVEGAELEYGIAKEQTNCLYGMLVTNNVRDEVSYTDSWELHKLSLEEITEKLDKMRSSGRERLAYQWGVWVTAYARRNLFYALIKTKGHTVAYVDTDSLKSYFENETDYKAFRELLSEINEGQVQKLDQALKAQKIDPERARPCDKEGKVHQLGVFDYEGKYERFRTWGAKKYAFEKLNKEGELKLGVTVSGMNKHKAINDPKFKSLDDFTIGRTWSEDYSGRTVSTYLDNMTPETIVDYLGNVYTTTDVYGINIEATTYTLGLADEYSYFIGYHEVEDLKETERLSIL